ncbi:hypothetical protein LCGC14_2669480, partial [marine sediment metagenome]
MVSTSVDILLRVLMEAKMDKSMDKFIEVLAQGTTLTSAFGAGEMGKAFDIDMNSMVEAYQRIRTRTPGVPGVKPRDTTQQWFGGQPFIPKGEMQTFAPGFAGMPGGKMPDTMKKGAKELTKLAAAFGKTGKAKTKLDKNLKKITKTSENFIQKIVKMGGQLRSVSRLFFYASLDMRQFAMVLLGPMMEGIQIAAEYNKTM